eukprot:CAMPEP_0185847928 /NCGR_PEP_ID=MMETSP1354-20130828/2996_1 /TAXON_ID=708628 /ORGANISM="Erythrolobus madagascarensis, Strain CCMP3276" /LENGTH=183 /DNA_ID=CAMNT_0028548263 /DNA_START=73 /DNA_END=624 /DNA_ORIENTATION=-
MSTSGASAQKGGKSRASPMRNSGLNIYVDGACLSNGQHEAVSGYGIWFGDEDERNVSRSLREEKQTCRDDAKQTNNRAELHALIHALEIVKQGARASEETVVIWSDSSLTVKGANEWMQNWKQLGWARPGKRTLVNADLWIKLDAALSSVRATHNVEIRWVRGHSGVYGNERADALANEGALR